MFEQGDFLQAHFIAAIPGALEARGLNEMRFATGYSKLLLVFWA